MLLGNIFGTLYRVFQEKGIRRVVNYQDVLEKIVLSSSHEIGWVINYNMMGYCYRRSHEDIFWWNISSIK